MDGLCVARGGVLGEGGTDKPGLPGQVRGEHAALVFSFGMMRRHLSCFASRRTSPLLRSSVVEAVSGS